MDNIDASDVQGMVSHWLGTPVNGYLGSGYGTIVPDLLQQPQKTGMGDAVLNKLRIDVPLVGALPRGKLNMYAVDEAPDIKRIYIDVSGALVESKGNV